MADGRVRVTFAGSGDASGSGGRFQACLHIGRESGPPVLLDCGATSLVALKRLRLDPNDVAAVFVSHLHGDHFGGLPFLILDAQFRRRTQPLVIAGPPGLRQRLTGTMEALYPGSSAVPRKFAVEVLELTPGAGDSVAGVGVSAWEVDRASGAPPLALRLGASLLVAEAYYLDKDIPYHLNHRTLLAHRDELDCDRVVLTHMSADMLAHADQAAFETAHDGFTVTLGAD